MMPNNRSEEEIRDLQSLESAIEGYNPVQLSNTESFKSIIDNTLLIGEFNEPVPIAQTGSGLRVEDVKWYGSGFKLTQDGIIITAYHVVEKIEARQANGAGLPETSRCFVMDPSGRRYGLDSAYRKLIQSPDADFTILKIGMGADAGPVPFLAAKEDLPAGDFVTIHGYSGTEGAFLVDGRPGMVVSIDAKFNELTTGRRLFDPFVMRANASSGYSGGPIVSSRGELIGILSGSLDLDPRYTLGVKLKHITDGIQKMARYVMENR